MIQTGIGGSFIPSILWSKVVTVDIKLLHISEPRCRRTIYLSWPAGERLTDTENSFFEFILQFFREVGIRLAKKCGSLGPEKSGTAAILLNL